MSGHGKTIVRAGVGEFFERESLQGGLNLGFNPPFNQAQLGSRTLDSAAEPFPGAFASNQGIPIFGLDTSGKMGYNWQYNVSVGRELTPTTTLEVGYVGSIGRRLLRPYDVNQVPLANRLDYIHTGADSDARAALRPYGVFGDENIQILAHGGSTNYNSLQTQIVSRFRPGSQFQASYTWSRTIGDVPLTGSEFGISGDTQSVRENPGLDRGLTQTHRAHIFNASLVLALPDLEGKPAVIHHLLGSWEIGTIVQAMTGTPLTIFTGSVPDLVGGVSGTGFEDNQRPNRVPGVDCRATSGPKEQWLNPAAWTLNDFALGTFGNSGRGVCIGPGFAQMDLAFYKNIPIAGHVKGQFRFEVFNVTNRVNFVGVDTSLNPTTVTFDTGDASTATKIVDYTPSGSFGQASGTRDPRQAQFGFKVTF